jgi:hypothetical protein
MRGGDLDGAVEPERGQRGVEVAHGGDEVRRVELVVVEHLVADDEVAEPCGDGVGGEAVGAEPLQRAVGPGGGEEGEVLVGHADGEVDAGRGEGREDCRVWQEEPRLGDAVLPE